MLKSINNMINNTSNHKNYNIDNDIYHITL